MHEDFVIWKAQLAEEGQDGWVQPLGDQAAGKLVGETQALFCV